MDKETHRLILELMERHNLCTLATMREDGWPQATTVSLSMAASAQVLRSPSGIQLPRPAA